MTTKYKLVDHIPTEILANRLNELADVVTKGQSAIDREFVMRVPAELDRDPDLVMSAAAKRLIELEKIVSEKKS